MTIAATRLAVAMARFAQSTPASRQAPSSPWRWQLVPDGRRFTYHELLAALDALPKPLCIAPAVNPGVLAVWTVADVHPTQRARIEWELQNQEAGLRERFVGEEVPDDAPVLLELVDDVLELTMRDLRAYASAYLHMGCGWRVAPPRAAGEPHRMTLLHVDGSRSAGGASARSSLSRALLVLLAGLSGACSASAPATIVVGKADTAVVNHRGPVPLPARVLDAAGRELARPATRVEPVTGTAVRVTDDGRVVCVRRADAVVRVSAGDAATLAVVRCRPVAGIRVAPGFRLRLADGARLLPIAAVGDDGLPVDVFAARLHVHDSTVVRLHGNQVEPVGLGETSVEAEIGDCRAAIPVEVFARAGAPHALRPHEEFLEPALRLEAGETRRWPLTPGRYELSLEPEERAARGLRLRGTGLNCARFPGDPGQHYSCLATDGAELRVEHADDAPSPGPIAGALLVRRLAARAAEQRTDRRPLAMTNAERRRMCGLVM